MAEQEQLPLIRVIKFKTIPEEICKRDKYGVKMLDEKGKHILENVDVDWVVYAPNHSPIKTHTEERIRHMIPGKLGSGGKQGEKHKFMSARWVCIEKAYNAWKKGHEIPVDGTPLSQWPGISTEKAEILNQIGIRTVEDVKSMTVIQLERARIPDIRTLQKSATAFLDNSDTAAVAAKQASQDKKIEDLQEQLTAAMELLEEKTEQPKVDDEVAQLRSELDDKGIKYHHMNKADTLRDLLMSEAA